MRSWLEALLGVDLSGVDGARGWSLDWTRAPERGDAAFFALLGLAAVTWIVVKLYRKDGPTLPVWRRRTLVSLRLGVALGLMAMLLEPRLIVDRVHELQSSLVVLIDSSASMDIRDGFDRPAQAVRVARSLGLVDESALDGLSRRQLSERILDLRLRNGLADDDRRIVRTHVFADRFFQDSVLPPELAGKSSEHTAIGTALEQALAAYPGQPLAGVLLISDGQSNSGPSPLASADLLMATGTVVNVMACGTQRDPKNLAVTAVEASPVVFERDPIRVAVHVESRGLEGESVELLFERRLDGGEFETIESQTIELGMTGSLETREFSQVFDRPGTVDFRARLESLDGEVTDEDNVASTTTRVVRRKVRCLLVAGLAFPEVQFLINTLMRDPGIELSSWLMFAEDSYRQKGNRQITRLPRTREELDAYDCVILYDPDLSQMPAGFTESLTHFVGERAGGLIYLAGESATSDLFERRLPGADSLLEVLPVIRQPGSYRTAVEQALAGRTRWNLEITEEGLKDEIFRFHADPAENAKTILSLPGFYWHFAVTREKPGATVLARHGDPRMSNRHGRHVAVATQLYGPGRSYFLAMDSTYRWRFVDEQLFDGFWARVVDRASRGKVLGGRGAFVLSSDRGLYPPGSVVTLRARFDDQAGRDPGLQMLAGLVQAGDDRPEPIHLSPSSEDSNLFEARYRLRQSGEHRVQVWPSDLPQEGARGESLVFRVEFPNREYSSPGQDRPTLAAIASRTGGQVFDLEDFEAIPQAFSALNRTRIERQSQELWNAPLLVGLTLLMLFAEWVLRKRSRLV